MSNYVKPQSPLYNEHNDTYIYPLTTVDQIIMPDGSRMDPENLGGNKVKLNYSVVGGTTQPSNPTENMIWVNTDQEITGHCFNQNEPKEFQEGMIWIKLGFRSHISFYKIQINEIGVEEIYPLQTYQRLNDSWVVVPTAIYQNNIWNYFLLYLYHNGNEFNNITGGWKANSVSGSTYTKDKTYMQIKVTSGVSSNTMTHNNVLALDSIYDYLCFDLDVTNNNDHILLYYASTAGSTLASKKITGNQSRQIFKIPITGINTPGYVKCNVNGDSLTTFYSIWLE